VLLYETQNYPLSSRIKPLNSVYISGTVLILYYFRAEGNASLLKYNLGKNLISIISNGLEIYITRTSILNHSLRIPEPINWSFAAG
jgi:hypothetical protein